jgi:hypothetical protein
MISVNITSPKGHDLCASTYEYVFKIKVDCLKSYPLAFHPFLIQQGSENGVSSPKANKYVTKKKYSEFCTAHCANYTPYILISIFSFTFGR